MDSRTNGHGDHDRRPSEPGPPRLPADGRAPRRSSVDSLRAADQLARLEARIREFHVNLDRLEGPVPLADRGPVTAAPGTAGIESPDDTVRRVAAAARVAVSGRQATRRDTGTDAGSRRDKSPEAPITANGTPNGTSAPTLSNGDSGQRRRRSDRPADPIASQRRIDALRPDPRVPAEKSPASGPGLVEPVLGASALGERIRREAERQSEQLREEAETEADRIRDAAELEMQELWQTLEGEVEAIQTEIARRVHTLAERMEAVGGESDHMRALAEAEAEQIRDGALAEARQIRALADEDAEELLALAEREAHALIAAARGQVEALVASTEGQSDLSDPAFATRQPDPGSGRFPHREPERSAAERIAEQIRDATAALTRRLGRTVEDPPVLAREIRGPAIVPASIRELLEGLVSAVSLIERSLTGLADLLGDTLGVEPSEDR